MTADTSARSRSKVDTPTGTVYSSLNPSLRSINLSPEDSETSRRSDIDTTLQSSILPNSSRYSSASSRRDTIESSVPSSSRRSSISTAASSRRSSRAVPSDEEEGDEFDRSTEEQHESGFDADRSNDMNDTTFNASKSGRLSNASSRVTTGTAVNTSAGTTTPANSRLSRPSAGENSLLLTAPSAGSASKAPGSGKRVSFSGGLGGGLSPISGDASQPPTEGSKRTNKSRSSFPSSVASGSAELSRSSAGQSSVQDSNRDDAFEDDNDAGGFGDGYDGYDDYPVDDSQRMMSQTDTPLTSSKSISRSGNGTGMDSALRTPYSEQDLDDSAGDLRSASGGRDRSRRITIPTPGSRDFVRGVAVPDETYIEEGSSEEAEMETDEEADTSAVITPAGTRTTNRTLCRNKHYVTLTLWHSTTNSIYNSSVTNISVLLSRSLVQVVDGAASTAMLTPPR